MGSHCWLVFIYRGSSFQGFLGGAKWISSIHSMVCPGPPLLSRSAAGGPAPSTSVTWAGPRRTTSRTSPLKLVWLNFFEFVSRLHRCPFWLIWWKNRGRSLVYLVLQLTTRETHLFSQKGHLCVFVFACEFVLVFVCVCDFVFVSAFVFLFLSNLCVSLCLHLCMSFCLCVCVREVLSCRCLLVLGLYEREDRWETLRRQLKHHLYSYQLTFVGCPGKAGGWSLLPENHRADL